MAHIAIMRDRNGVQRSDQDAAPWDLSFEMAHLLQTDVHICHVGATKIYRMTHLYCNCRNTNWYQQHQTPVANTILGMQMQISLKQTPEAN